MIEHSGRVAVVTGGSSGIGRGIAQRLQREGARVSVLDVAEPPSGDAAASLEFYNVDVAQESAVDAAFSEIERRHGSLDYLVCCAAIFPARPFLDITLEMWQRTLDINLTGSFLCCRAAMRSMRPRGSGRIVLFASNMARRGGVGCAHYATSKGGVLGLARSLALEAIREGIRVNCMSPGVTDTPQPKRSMSEEDFRRFPTLVPLGRIASVEDIVEGCMFLLGDDASFIVGQDLRINGGQPLW